MYLHDFCWYFTDHDTSKLYFGQLLFLDKVFKGKSPKSWDFFRHMETCIKEVNFMARKKATKSDVKATVSKEIRWINANISAEDQPLAEQWLDTNVTELLGFMCAIAERGFSISLKQGKNSDYMCTVFGVIVSDGVAENIGVSAFALTPDDALAGLLFKFVVLLDFGANLPEREDRVRLRFR